MKGFTLISVVLCFTMLFAVPIEVSAAQANRTLQTGRAYEFTNTDARTIAYVTPSGSARYDYVTRGASGEVVDFGVSSGRFPVRSGGSTLISLSGSVASVSFDSEKITLREAGNAALSRVKLAANETVSMTSRLEMAVNIAADNTGRTEYATYDVVVRERSGTVAFFANMSRYTAVSLPASGSATFTAGASGLTLMYPAAWAEQGIRVEKAEQSSLVSRSMDWGKTYTVTNAGSAECTIGVAGAASFKYDYIRADATGYVTDYGHAAQHKQITLEAGGNLFISPLEPAYGAALDTVKLVIPNENRNTVLVKEGGHAALSVITAAIGETITFKNNSRSMPFTFRQGANPSGDASANASAVLDYVYDGGPFEEAVYATDTPFTEMTVGAGGVWTLTVKKGSLILRMPAAWLSGGLSVSGSPRAALAEHNLTAGASLTLTNTDLSSAYDIQLVSAADRGLSYDYMIQDDIGVQYGSDSDLTILTLPPGGVMTLTAGKAAPLRVRLPDVSAVTVRETTVSTVDRYDLAPGQSLRVTNQEAARRFVLSMQGAAQIGVTTLDYVLKDDTGRITDFGRADTQTDFALEAGESVLFTNASQYLAAVTFPGAWLKEGLQAERTEAQALTCQTLTENKAVEIVNQDRKYDRFLWVESASGARSFPVKYDYVVKNDKSTVMDYGVGSEGELYLYGGGRAVIMPQAGVTLSVSCPSEWYGKSINISEASASPLYRAKLKPGQRLKLESRSNLTYNIQTADGRYYLRYDGDNSRVAASESTHTGVFEVPPNTKITVIAAAGSDLEICMPRDWAGKLVQ